MFPAAGECSRLLHQMCTFFFEPVRTGAADSYFDGPGVFVLGMYGATAQT